MIWQNFLELLRSDDKRVYFDEIVARMDDLARCEINDRQIRNAVMTAPGLPDQTFPAGNAGGAGRYSPVQEATSATLVGESRPTQGCSLLGQGRENEYLRISRFSVARKIHARPRLRYVGGDNTSRATSHMQHSGNECLPPQPREHSGVL